jgi:orotate phosphoribosyltransferase
LIIDDVISAGTSVRDSITLIQAAGATPAAVAIALDRQERATEVTADGVVDTPWSAVQYVTQQLKLKVLAIASLQDLLHYLRSGGEASLGAYAAPVQAYRDRYGV